MNRTTTTAVNRLFRDQLGVASTQQLLAAGMAMRTIDRRREHGDWGRLASGVWRTNSAPRTWHQQLWIAALAAGPGAAVSHRSAAALHGLDGFPPGLVEVVVPRSRRQVAPGWHVHSTSRLARPDLVTLDGLAVTSAARTIIDLASLAAVTNDQLGNAIDSAHRLGLATPTYVIRHLDSLGRSGRHGTNRLAELMLDSGGHSFLERRLLQLLRRAGLPRPKTQVVHRANGRHVARVDFEWTPSWLVVEVSGRRGHVTETDRTCDATRRNALQQDGFLVIEFTTSMLMDDPASVISTITHSLTSQDGQRRHRFSPAAA